MSDKSGFRTSYGGVRAFASLHDGLQAPHRQVRHSAALPSLHVPPADQRLLCTD